MGELQSPSPQKYWEQNKVFFQGRGDMYIYFRVSLKLWQPTSLDQGWEKKFLTSCCWILTIIYNCLYSISSWRDWRERERGKSDGDYFNLLLSKQTSYWSISCCCHVMSHLLDPMDCSTPGFPVLHHLPELAQTHVHWVSDVIQPSPLSSPSPSAFNLSFLVSWLFASDGQSIGASASVSVLPMNILGWFPLGLTGLISLQSEGLSRVFSSPTVQKH